MAIRPLKSHSGVDQFGLEGYHLDAGVRMGSAVALGCNAASARVGGPFSHSQSTASVVTMLLLVRITNWFHATACRLC